MLFGQIENVALSRSCVAFRCNCSLKARGSVRARVRARVRERTRARARARERVRARARARVRLVSTTVINIDISFFALHCIVSIQQLKILMFP